MQKKGQQKVAVRPEKVMQKFLFAFTGFCIAAGLILLDSTRSQYIAYVGMVIMLPSFMLAMYCYIQLLKLRLGRMRRKDDPFSQEANPDDIAKALAKKKNNTGH